jgi:hypothetical protein
LTGLGARTGETKPIDNIVQSSLQPHKQVGSGNTFLPFGLLKEDVELLFRKTVHSFHFLFFSQLDAVIRWFSAPTLSMLTRRICPSIKGTFIRITAISFKKKL